MPLIARWPDRIKAGTESEAFGHSTDLLPTFCAAAGISLPADSTLDGLNLLPHWTGAPVPTDEARGMVFWQMDLYRSLQRHYLKPEPYATEVVRDGRWKLLALDGTPVELFDVSADPNEARNLLREHPEIVTRMTEALAAWLAEPPIAPLGRGSAVL